MTETPNLSDSFCDRTFKNILRNKNERDFHKEHIQANFKSGSVTDRSVRSHTKYYDNSICEQLDLNKNLKNKYESQYVTGNLKSNFDLKNETKPEDLKFKYSHIRTKSAIELVIPQLKKKEIYIFQESKKENIAKQTKKKTYTHSNNSINVFNFSKTNKDSTVISNYVSERMLKVNDYLGSQGVKKSVYTNYNTYDLSRSDKIINCDLNTVKNPSGEVNKYRKNGPHNFNGKRGFY